MRSYVAAILLALPQPITLLKTLNTFYRIVIVIPVVRPLLHTKIHNALSTITPVVAVLLTVKYVLKIIVGALTMEMRALDLANLFLQVIVMANFAQTIIGKPGLLTTLLMGAQIPMLPGVAHAAA